MTKVGRLFEEEKEQAVKAAVEAERKAARKAVREARKAANKKAAEANARFLVDCVERTATTFDLTVDEVCEKMLYNKADYMAAKKLISRATRLQPV